MFIWVALFENVRWARIVWNNYRSMFESRLSAGVMVKLRETKANGKPDVETISSRSYDMEGHVKMCVGRSCELANKTTQQLYKVATPCMDDHQFREEENWSVGDFSTVCSQIVLTCLYLARIGRLDIPWSVHKLARAVTKMDKKLVTSAWIDWLHTFITHVNTNSIAMWVILQMNAGWDCFKTPIFAGDLEDSKSTSGEIVWIFGSHTFVSISWMCKKQTAVSHSSTESEIISLDTGLRLDGLFALELWDLIVSVLGNVFRVSDRSGKPVNGKNKSHNKIDVIQDIDSVPSNVQSASREALLYVFEDNEAVTKMIMKGRSPTMRHVSRTHRVALDWLFDRINLDSKIQIKYIDTKNPTRRHLNQREFHTWKMESFVEPF